MQRTSLTSRRSPRRERGQRRQGHALHDWWRPQLRKRLAVVACATALLLAAAGCGNSADPETWEEADSAGNVQENFMNSCLLAYEESSGGLSEGDVVFLCRCMYDGLRSELLFDDFKQLDKALRSSPNPSDLDDSDDDGAETSWDDTAERTIKECVGRL